MLWICLMNVLLVNKLCLLAFHGWTTIWLWNQHDNLLYQFLHKIIVTLILNIFNKNSVMKNHEFGNVWIEKISEKKKILI